MSVNVWATVGGVTSALPLVTLLGSAHQLLGMNAAATMGEWKAATFNSATNQLAVPVGSVGAPSYTFTGNLNYGMWFEGGTIRWGTSGVRRMRLGSSALVLDVNIQLDGTLLQENFGADITAAATTDLGTATGNVLTVTHAAGVLSITSLGGATLPAGTEIETIFSIAAGTLTLVHDAGLQILLGGVNVTLTTGDVVRWRKINDATAAWRMVSFQRGLAQSNLANKGDWELGVGSGNPPDILEIGEEGMSPIVDLTANEGVVWGATSQGSRQTVFDCVKNTDGYANFITAGAGLNFNISAVTTALILSFAAGFGFGGGKDFITVISANASNQGSLVTNNINFLHATRVSKNSVTWGSTLIPPLYAYAFDRTRGSILNFEGADASTSIIDDFGNTWAVSGNAQIDTAQAKFGASSLLLDGTGDFVTSTNFIAVGDNSWELSCWFRINALPGAGTFAALISATNAGPFGVIAGLFNTAGTTRLRFHVSGNGTTHNIVNAVDGTNTTWTLNQWNKLRLVFDVLAGTYRVYLSLNGAAETQDQTTNSTARVCAISRIQLGADGAGAQFFNGWIDAFRFIVAASVTGTQTPAAVAPTIVDFPYFFFSIPEMKMYEVTAASGVAGTNPTMTVKNLIFVGEADTVGGVVSAVRNYAIKGLYTSLPGTVPAANSSATVNSNLGTKPKYVELIFVNITTDSGYLPGEELRRATTGNATFSVPHIIRTDRNSISFSTQNTGAPLISTPKAGGDAINLTPANWQYRIEAARGW